MSINRQKGWIGEGLSQAVAGAMLMIVIVSAVAGWVLIEGVIWIFSHISIGWTS
ncbi:MAG: hypothetical protein AB7E55_04990 [Pigmentiphaga sp.]